MPAFPTAADAHSDLVPLDSRRTAYTRFVLLVAGLGGLLYGVDVGIIGGALPYLQATRQLSAGQLSIIVAAVLLGSVISTLFAGLLADLVGRKPLMILSGIAFSLSIPIIALSNTYSSLFGGRLLQGISGGFIGVVVPLYLAECLPASSRGRGTAIFQWLLTFGIFSAAVIGLYFSYRVTAMTATADAASLFRFKDHAWRSIFWVSLPPGALFVLGSLFVGESPRWLFRKGKAAQAEAALLRSRMPEQAALELEEMRSTNSSTSASPTSTQQSGSLFRRKYIIPFVLACVILACNQATGINSVIGYNTNILLQSGLSDLSAHWGYVIFTAVNFCMTMVGVALVDRKGRKFLFTLGCSGLFVSLVLVGVLFHSSESNSVDVTPQVQALVSADQTLTLPFNPLTAAQLLGSVSTVDNTRASLAVIYSYGDYTGATSIHRSDDSGSAPITVTRADALPGTRVESFFQNPFANLDAAKSAPLHIVGAKISAVPSSNHGWILALGLYLYMSFYAIGPGVCVWLALSELMPTRIRSNGMSIALVINQIVSTALAGVFLPVVSKHGYSFIFFVFAGCSLVYLLTVAFFLPETKGRTLEEIEQLFEKA